MVQKPEFAECEFKAGFTLLNRSIEPSAVDFVKPVGKPRLPLKTDQIQNPNQNASSIGSDR